MTDDSLYDTRNPNVLRQRMVFGYKARFVEDKWRVGWLYSNGQYEIVGPEFDTEDEAKAAASRMNGR